MKKMLISLFMLLLLSAPVMAAELKLFVAASLKDAITEITEAYASAHPDVSFLKNFASSGALAKQIANGAPCDVYLSANKKWMTYLQDNNLLSPDGSSLFAYNEVVFVGDPGLKVRTLPDVLKLDSIAIGSPKSVPAGEYAMQALQKAGLAPQLEKKLVMAKDVRECLMYADRGEVQGAFVYKTDALLAKNVKVLLTVPQELYPRVSYPGAVTATGAGNPEARAFLAFLSSGKAKSILTKYGFAVK